MYLGVLLWLGAPQTAGVYFVIRLRTPDVVLPTKNVRGGCLGFSAFDNDRFHFPLLFKHPWTTVRGLHGPYEFGRGLS